MVAYSFAPRFEDDIISYRKRQTVRGFRKRHARPGEAMQLYMGMRTKACRKLISPDPVCLDLRHVIIAQASAGGVAIEIEGRMLGLNEAEEFAIADGFGALLPDGCARMRMAQFWLQHHGPRSFGGVVIRWRPQ